MTLTHDVKVFSTPGPTLFRDPEVGAVFVDLHLSFRRPLWELQTGQTKRTKVVLMNRVYRSLRTWSVES